MARLEDKIAEIRNAELRQTIAAEVRELKDLLKKGRRFGLVFEEHLPELLPIYSAKIRSHARVARKDGRLTETFIVERVAKGVATVKPEQGEGEPQNIPVTELVVVKRFGEAIFPALRHVESVLRGGDAPHHILIEADNYHALQLLEWLYAGKVDCFYIDPPYNTGARDWKYNNNFIDSNDSYRHSKWLSMMSRRLKLARRLLKTNGVLIVTIDDYEYQHLRSLLSDLFPSYNIFTVVIEHNKRGRQGEEFAKTHEYALFVVPEIPGVIGEEPTDTLIGGETRNLRRTGNNSLRAARPKQFYPIWVNPKNFEIVEIGVALPADQKRSDKPKNNLVPIWPLDKKKVERNWHYGADRTAAELRAGKVFAREQSYGIQIYYTLKEKSSKRYKTVWSRPTLDASTYGSELLNAIFGRPPGFSFPKSLYAVRDCLATACLNRKDALVVDFFAGSGTTLNAVDLLNAKDGGHRRCILVTNNEVSAAEAETLLADGVSPGTLEWQQHGICQSVTYPRCKFVINGKRGDGTPLEGNYLTGRFAEQEVRRGIRSLDFATSEALSSKRAREALALAVGFTKSKVTGDESFLLGEGEQVAVLLEPDRLNEFIEQGEEWAEAIETVYLPFPAGKAFNEAKAQLAEGWPSLTKSTEIKRSMKDGFAANLDYFRLDFLDRARAEIGGKLVDVLPALWMMAGCRGKLPTAKGTEKMLLFTDSPFAVLIEESAVKFFLAKLAERPDIDWVFVVTHDQDSFARICEWLPEHIPATQRVHLWRNYVDNFLINVDRGTGGAP